MVTLERAAKTAAGIALLAAAGYVCSVATAFGIVAVRWARSPNAPDPEITCVDRVEYAANAIRCPGGTLDILQPIIPERTSYPLVRCVCGTRVSR